MPRPSRSSKASKNSRNTRKKSKRPHKWPAYEYEIEALAGLEEVAAAELAEVPKVRDVRGLRFWYAEDPQRLRRLRSVVAVYRIQSWQVPRPRGLLGNQQLAELTEFLRSVLHTHRSFRLSAAGKDSAVMQRLASEISQRLDLPHDPQEGELLIRLRPSQNGESWEVLARQTSRPLSAREWRVCNREGGLNANIAYAALRLCGMRPEDRIFNPMSGSGTLLIERALMGPYAAMVGVDIDPAAVQCARQNIQAAGRNIEVAEVDALNTGLPDRSFDLILADLPWGDAIGSTEQNSELYPQFLQEMQRLCSKNGRLCIVTHQIKLLEGLLASQQDWFARELFQAYSGGHHPKAYLLTHRYRD